MGERILTPHPPSSPKMPVSDSNAEQHDGSAEGAQGSIEGPNLQEGLAGQQHQATCFRQSRDDQ